MYLGLSYMIGLAIYEKIRHKIEREFSIMLGLFMVGFGLVTMGPNKLFVEFP